MNSKNINKKFFITILTAVILSTMFFTVLKAEDSSLSENVDLSKRIALDLRNMEIIDALKYLALRSGMNIVTSKSVTGRVTLQLKDVSIGDIFDIALLTNNLAYEKMGSIYYVMTSKEYEARYGKTFSDMRQIKVFRLNYAIPDKAFDMLDILKSKVGRILIDQDSGTVMIMDTPDKIEQMQGALEALEKNNETVIFGLQYAKAEDVEDQLSVYLDKKKVGSIRADERNNQVIVQALPGRMKEIRGMIKELDKKTKEVLIDTKIIKIKIDDDNVFGFEWEGMFEQMSNLGMTFVGSHPMMPIYRAGKSFIDQMTQVDTTDANLPAGQKTTGTEKVYFGVSDKFEAVFEYLQTLGETRLLSNPTISTINNQEARIHVGRREAYVTTTTTTGQTTTTTAEEVSFVDIGIQLSVTPTINDDGYVTMKVKPEVSSVVSTLETPSGNFIPIIDTSTAETTVMVKDGSTVIIGGLHREEEVNTSERVPFLSTIPFLGKIFKSEDKSIERIELLIMITPHIIEGDKIVTGEDMQSWQDKTKPRRAYKNLEYDKKEGYYNGLEYKLRKSY